MINDEIQKQDAGDGSTNLQSKNITINQGISYSDARDIALDVYKANFLSLSQNAADIARARAEEITDNFLKKLKEENESAIESMSEPSLQAALYEAQKQYAKSGDKDLEGLLVDILVERAITPHRNIHQIVLDESLIVAGKLTAEQMDALSVIFMLTRTSNRNLSNLEALPIYFEKYLIPFIDTLSSEISCYEHLEYVGCGTVQQISGMGSIEKRFYEQYGGLFARGFEIEKLEKTFPEYQEYPNVVTQCLHDQNLLQINAVNIEVVNEICEDSNMSDEIKSKVVSLYNSSRMSQKDVKDYILKVSPPMEQLFECWDKSSLSRFSLTTVGIAIAQANFRRKTGIRLDLSIWVK